MVRHAHIFKQFELEQNVGGSFCFTPQQPDERRVMYLGEKDSFTGSRTHAGMGSPSAFSHPVNIRVAILLGPRRVPGEW